MIICFSDLNIIPSRWSGTAQDAPPVFPLYEHYFYYIINFRNLTDLITVLPYYIGLGGKSGSITVFLRIFRLVKIVRIFSGLLRIDQCRRMMTLVFRTLVLSREPLSVLVGLIMMALIFFGSIIFVIEAGNFTINEDFPAGAYLRPTFNGEGLEISPFTSVPTSMYWVLITLTTGEYSRRRFHLLLL